MIENGSTLVGTVQMRVLRRSDAERMSAAYQRNREHLAPWEPARAQSFFTVAGQAASIESKLALFIAGSDVPWILLHGDLVIGVMTLGGHRPGPVPQRAPGVLGGQGIQRPRDRHGSRRVCR
jgi:ribosomal-protein-alanine N-acetyltransferase